MFQTGDRVAATHDLHQGIKQGEVGVVTGPGYLLVAGVTVRFGFMEVGCSEDDLRRDSG